MKLSIIIPTLNEHSNIEPLTDALKENLKSIDWEIIFVDDNSHDGTTDIIDSLTMKNPRIRCVKRPRQTGISSACIDGMYQSRSTYMAVMDADLQHDPRALHEMLHILENDDIELVIASRYVNGASILGWPKTRIFMSYVATLLTRLFIRTSVKDPLSGFFMLKRSLFEDNASRLCSLGSKILMSFLIYSKQEIKFKEIPFDFKTRHTGQSKHQPRLVWENCLIILKLFAGLPRRA